MRNYILKNKKPVLASSIEEWAKGYQKNRIVKQEKINDVFISTVFLGLDHSWGGGPPILFETIIFEGEHDQYQDRYCTWEEAEIGHEKAVNLVRTKLLNQKDGTTEENT